MPHADPAKQRAHIRAWQLRNPEKVKAYGRRAARRRLGFAPGEHERAEAARPEPGYRCAICGASEAKGKGWQADHDHRTGLFREWLCARCNNWRVAAREDRFAMVVEWYLRRHSRTKNERLRVTE